jgi:hypothetical protein
MSRLLGLFVGLAVLLALPAVAAARDSRDIRMQDRCDPATFNAVFGDGVCIKEGGVTLDEFLAQLNPKDGGDNHWRFKPKQTHLKPGGHLDIVNQGGETHSFTEVVDFGATPIPDFALLNNALPPGTPFAVPVGADLHFVPSGGTLRLDNLSVGTHKFECFIHPWMRTTIEQRSD